ncbi:MAG TPA: hypothetical protein DEP23_08725 [Ruminococcaceae bacterium]|nr:hypothetical protein [Oscillospiraceae bacterium]
MIKGVNRQIIEVIDTGNEYFERALLVVRPRFADTKPGRLHDEAQRFARNAGGYTSLRLNRKRNVKQLILHGGSFGAVGIVIGALIMSFIR